MKAKKLKPGQNKRRADYYAKRYREASVELAALGVAANNLRLERDENIKIRRMLIEVGVVSQKGPYLRDYTLCYRVNEETLRQIRDVKTFVDEIARMLSEKMMKNWEDKQREGIKI